MKKKNKDWVDHALYALLYFAACGCAYHLGGGWAVGLTICLIALARQV